MNEGKVSQSILSGIFTVVNMLQAISKKIKGTYVPLKFKDKTIDRKVYKSLMILMDYSLFDTLKYYLSKKYRDQANDTSFTELIKTRSGIDIYLVIDSIILSMKEDNILFSNNPETKSKQELKLKETLETVKKFKSVFKKVDDNIIELQDMNRQFKELGEIMKGLDPRNPKNLSRDTEDTLSVFDAGLKHINKMQQPKELDDILDKISKYGIDSLTDKEKEDLDKHSN